MTKMLQDTPTPPDEVPAPTPEIDTMLMFAAKQVAAELHHWCERAIKADAEIARLRDLCLRASSWVEDVQTDGNEATREKRNFVEQLQLAARKETQ